MEAVFGMFAGMTTHDFMVMVDLINEAELTFGHDLLDEDVRTEIHAEIERRGIDMNH